jgi:hypothetical protein
MLSIGSASSQQRDKMRRDMCKKSIAFEIVERRDLRGDMQTAAEHSSLSVAAHADRYVRVEGDVINGLHKMFVVMFLTSSARLIGVWSCWRWGLNVQKPQS